MKFVAKTNELIKAVQSCSKVIATASASPILTNILIDCISKKDDGLIRLFVTDLEMYYEVFVLANIEISGEVMVSWKTFSNVLEVFSGTENITFICNKENFNIELSAGNTECTLYGMPSDDFPQMPTWDTNSSYQFKMPLLKLQSLIKNTSYAISLEQIKPAYCGLYFKPLNNAIRAVSTDGKRLALCEYQIENSEIKEYNEVIVISKVINELSRNTCEAGEDVEILICPNQIAFKTKHYAYYSRLIDAKFPDYNMVIPKECKLKLSVPVNELIRELKKMLPIASESSNTVKFNITNDKIVFSAKSPKSGSIKSELKIEPLISGELEINFNAKFFMDAVGTIKSTNCILEFNTPQTPVKIYPKEELENEMHIHVLMPVRPGFNV